jgi:site-specific recombinase XerD
MSRNFGLGSRVMSDAGRMALDRAAGRGDVSFSTAATQADRWASFSAWAKEQGVGRMERIDKEMVRAYGRELADQVKAGDLAPATAQNYVSAVNSVMSLATKGAWESVSPTKDCGIAQRSAVREDAPGALDRAACARAIEAVRVEVGDRAAAVVELARELGLRSKEASLLDARSALAEARDGSVSISDGTKGGLTREVPITNETQFQALERAAAAQGDARAVMPPGENWQAWREGGLRDAREAVQAATGAACMTCALPTLATDTKP